jgi:hypothetical protein
MSPRDGVSRPAHNQLADNTRCQCETARVAALSSVSAVQISSEASADKCRHDANPMRASWNPAGPDNPNQRPGDYPQQNGRASSTPTRTIFGTDEIHKAILVDLPRAAPR